MDPLEVGAVHQAMAQGITEHGAQTAEQVQQATDRPQTNDRHKAHMRLGEVIPVTGDMRTLGGVIWAKGETIPAIRIEGIYQIQNPVTRRKRSINQRSLDQHFEGIRALLERLAKR